MKKNPFNRICAILLLMFLSAASFGQNARTITGKVTDSGGAPLPGTNVIVLGTTTGVQTDLNGTYTISVQNPSGAVLEFSFIGYTKQQVTVGNQTTVNVTLQEEYIGLNELVVVGYGTVKKKDLTGSVSSIKSAEITKTGSPSNMPSTASRSSTRCCSAMVRRAMTTRSRKGCPMPWCRRASTATIRKRPSST